MDVQFGQCRQGVLGGASGHARGGDDRRYAVGTGGDQVGYIEATIELDWVLLSVVMVVPRSVNVSPCYRNQPFIAPVIWRISSGEVM